MLSFICILVSVVSVVISYLCVRIVERSVKSIAGKLEQLRETSELGLSLPYRSVESNVELSAPQLPCSTAPDIQEDDLWIMMKDPSGDPFDAGNITYVTIKAFSTNVNGVKYVQYLADTRMSMPLDEFLKVSFLHHRAATVPVLLAQVKFPEKK